MTDQGTILKRYVRAEPVYRRDVIKPDGRNLSLYGYAPHKASEIAGDALDQLTGAHLRYHPLRGTWSIYAAARNQRTFKPSQAENPLAPSQTGKPLTEIPFSDFELCVFDNRFPSLSADAHEGEVTGLTTAPAKGACEVIVYTPDATGSLADLNQAQRRLLVEAWIDRYENLFAKGCAFVLPFENRGEAVGVTLSHPHGQIYGFPFIPDPQARALAAFEAGYDLAGKLTDWKNRYGVLEAGGLMAYAPPFARFPYEVWISAFARHSGPWSYSETESDGFAYLLGEVTRRYDALFGAETPYMLSLHAAPYGQDGAFQFSAQFYPLLRGPGRVKYLASVEQATGVFTVDVMPEAAAQALRGVK